MQNMPQQQQNGDTAMSDWARFYRTGTIRDYLQYRNCARQEEYPNAAYRQGSGDPGDSLRRER